MWLRYGQKQDIKNIETLKPNFNVCQTLTLAKQQLQRSFLWWIHSHFGLSLETETQQIEEIIEDWLLTNLLYQEIQRN